MFDPKPSDLIYCVECLLPVRLEEAKTNGEGKPVHESCYVYRLREAEQQREDKHHIQTAKSVDGMKIRGA